MLPILQPGEIAELIFKLVLRWLLSLVKCDPKIAVCHQRIPETGEIAVHRFKLTFWRRPPSALNAQRKKPRLGSVEAAFPPPGCG
jgi:hypothetical protein